MLAEPVPTDAELEAAAAKTEARPSPLCPRDYLCCLGLATTGLGVPSRSRLTAVLGLVRVQDKAARAKQLDGLRAVRDLRAGFRELAPGAFGAPSEEVAAFVARVGRNWVTSKEPLGTAVELEGSCMPSVRPLPAQPCAHSHCMALRSAAVCSDLLSRGGSGVGGARVAPIDDVRRDRVRV